MAMQANDLALLGRRSLAKAIRAAVYDKRLEIQYGLKPRIFIDADVAIGATLAPFDLVPPSLDSEAAPQSEEQRWARLRAYVGAFLVIGRYGDTYITWPHLTELNRRTTQRYRDLPRAPAGLTIPNDLRGAGNSYFRSVLELIEELKSRDDGSCVLSWDESLRLSEALTNEKFPIFEVCSWKSPDSRSRRIASSLRVSGSWAAVKAEVSRPDTKLGEIAMRFWQLEGRGREHPDPTNPEHAAVNAGDFPSTNAFADAAALVQLRQEIGAAAGVGDYVRFYSHTNRLYRFCIFDPEMSRSLAVRDSPAVDSHARPEVDSRGFPLRSHQYMYLRAIFPSLKPQGGSSRGGPGLDELERFAMTVSSLSSSCDDANKVTKQLGEMARSAGINKDANAFINAPATLSFANAIWLSDDSSLFEALGSQFERKVPELGTRRQMAESILTATNRVLEVEKQLRTIIDTDRVRHVVRAKRSALWESCAELPVTATSDAAGFVPGQTASLCPLGAALFHCLVRLENEVRTNGRSQNASDDWPAEADFHRMSQDDMVSLFGCLLLECATEAEPLIRHACLEDRATRGAITPESAHAREVKSLVLELALLWSHAQSSVLDVFAGERGRDVDPVEPVRRICSKADAMDRMIERSHGASKADICIVRCCLSYICSSVAFALRQGSNSNSNSNSKLAGELILHRGLAYRVATEEMGTEKGLLGEFIAATHFLIQSEAHHFGLRARCKFIDSEYSVYDRGPRSLIYNYAFMRMEHSGEYHPRRHGIRDREWPAEMRKRIAASTTRFLPPTLASHLKKLMSDDL